MPKTENDIPTSQFFDFEIFPLDDEFTGKITGGNKRNILVLTIPAPDQSDHQFLGKVLSAVQVAIDDDIALATAEKAHNFNLVELVGVTGAKVVLIFGVKPLSYGLNINMKLYQPVLHNGTKYLLCNQLGEIAQNQQLKRHLWSALQQIFPTKDR
ncbi:MAG: hypothetical protein Kow0027_12430 [Saprospiraceae bacterium]